MKDDIEILRGLSRCEDKEQMARYLERIEESTTADNGGTLAKDTNVLTNGDWIRAMNDEELKVFICSLTSCEVCRFATSGGCIAYNWLLQPAEVPDGG